MFDQPFVKPMTDVEQADWDDCKNIFAKDGYLQRIELLEEHVPIRFIRGSAFLKSRPKRLKRIVQTLEDYIDWSEKIGLQTTFSQRLPKLRQFRDCLWPLKYYGKSMDGRIVFLLCLRECDLKEAAKLFPEDELHKYIAYNMEVYMLSVMAWKGPSRTIIIFDTAGMSMGDYYLAYKAGLANVLLLLGKNYPESLDKFYAINAPSIFSWCFSVMKPFIEPDTVEKIHLVSRKSMVPAALKSEGIILERFPSSIFKEGKDAYVYLISDEIISLHEDEEKRNDLNDETIKSMIVERQVQH